MRHSKKALTWLAYKEQIDRCKIFRGRNGREYRLHELSLLSVDGFCPETKQVFEFLGCYFHGHTCLTFRDVTTDRYQQTMTRLAQITQTGYQVEVMWECNFDRDILLSHRELKTHPIVQHGPLTTRDALYGGRIEAMSLHYKI
jgi:G:T-mismatch repair DNA endonuclease (very short patch repair protein)